MGSRHLELGRLHVAGQVEVEDDDSGARRGRLVDDVLGLRPGHVSRRMKELQSSLPCNILRALAQEQEEGEIGHLEVAMNDAEAVQILHRTDYLRQRTPYTQMDGGVEPLLNHCDAGEGISGS